MEDVSAHARAYINFQKYFIIFDLQISLTKQKSIYKILNQN